MVTKLKIAIIAVIAIAAIVGITLGIVYGTRSDDDDTCTSIFNAPKLELELVNDRLYASWTEPDNLEDCSVIYNLKYTVDGGTQVSRDLKERQFKFEDLELKPCSEVVVILTAVNENGDASKQATETFTKGVVARFGGVSDLTISRTDFDILIKWIGPTGFEKCDLKYNVTVGDESTIVDGLEHAATVGYCSTSISVLPVIGDVEGIRTSERVAISVEEGFVSIHEMVMERFDVYLEGIWERLPGFEACIVDYRVALNDYPAVYTRSREIRFDLPEETCVDHTMTVTPVISLVRGASLSETVHIGGCPLHLDGGAR